MSRLWARFALVGGLGAAAAVAFARLPQPAAAERGERFIPKPEVARASALGFEAVLADYYWLQAVQLVGGTPRASRKAERIGKLIDVTTTLNPRVSHPYRFAALWMTDDRESVREANRLLRRGIAYHPEDWRNYFYLGFNHFYYLNDFETAARTLEATLELPGSPVYLQRLVARLRAQGRGLETAAAFLEELARSTPSPYARAEYRKALAEIETERRARLLDRARAAFRRRQGRDIERVGELARGPGRVLERLPPEPHGAEWEIDGETGRIVSSHYGHRYEPQFHPAEHARRRAFQGAAQPQEGSR